MHVAPRIVVHCCPLLSIAVHRCPLLSIVVHWDKHLAEIPNSDLTPSILMFPLYLQGSAMTAPRAHVYPFNALHIRTTQIASGIFGKYVLF